MRVLLFASILALAACGQNAPPAETSASAPSTANLLFTYGGGQAPLLVDMPNPYFENMPPPAWFICDSIDGPTAFVASIPDEGGMFGLARFDKSTQQIQRMTARTSGAPFDAPNGPAQAFDIDGAQGIIYTLAPARLSSPDAATTTPVIGIDLAGEEFNCRWFEQMLFMGFTDTQSVVVRRTANAGIELMTFDFNSEGALMVEMQHGEQSTVADVTAAQGRQGAGHNQEDVVQWTFEHATDGLDYHVWTAPAEASVLQPVRNGEIDRTEEFRAYLLARS